MEKYPNSEACFLIHSKFDHTPVIIKFGLENRSGHKPFRFFNHWMNMEEFFPLITGIWEQQMQGNKMYVVCRKLKATKMALKEIVKQKQESWKQEN